MRLEPWKDIAIGAGVGALSGLAGSVAGYGTVDWGWLASAGASGAAGAGTGVGVQALDGGVTWKEAGIAMASGVGSSIASGAAMRPFSSSAGDLVIEQDGDGNLYRLSDYTVDQATNLFEDWGKAQGFKGPNLKDVRLQFGETGGAPAYTLNDRITLNEQQLSKLNLPREWSC